MDFPCVPGQAGVRFSYLWWRMPHRHGQCLRRPSGQASLNLPAPHAGIMLQKGIWDLHFILPKWNYFAFWHSWSSNWLMLVGIMISKDPEMRAPFVLKWWICHTSVFFFICSRIATSQQQQRGLFTCIFPPSVFQWITYAIQFWVYFKLVMKIVLPGTRMCRKDQLLLKSMGS